MEPVTLLLVGATHAAAMVARKVADDLTTDLWTLVKGELRKVLGREPRPEDVTAKQLAQAVEAPDIEARLKALLGSSSALRRALVVEKALKDARVLWIDDHPAGNIWEHDCLSALGMRIKTVETTRSATECLELEMYDIILSDVYREGRPSAGVEDLPELKRRAPDVPLILYVTALKPGVPADAFGITSRPDELLHLCMDALERKRP